MDALIKSKLTSSSDYLVQYLVWSSGGKHVDALSFLVPRDAQKF